MVVIDRLIAILTVMMVATLDCVTVVFYFWMIACLIILPLGMVVLALMPLWMIIHSIIRSLSMVVVDCWMTLASPKY
jgi:hypothetical protein